MTKYILSDRPFREEFQANMQAINKEYQFVLAEDLAEKDWTDIEITLGWKKAWNKKLLHDNTSLKWVQSISAGVDYLPLDEFRKYNILLTNASGVHAQSIADHLIAVLLMQSRGILSAIKNQLDAKWQASDNYSLLSDLRILIVGTGKIGQQLASYLNTFDNQPIGINTSGHAVKNFAETFSLKELFKKAAKADVIINILPLTEDTYHLYNTAFFENMKPSASFINVGRGGSVASDDLYQALKNKVIAFAAIDVFEKEPLPSDDPFWQLDNILITPHISGFTPHFQKRFMEIFLNNLASFNQEQKVTVNQVSLDSGY